VSDRKRGYVAHLLRLWQLEAKEDAPWRAPVESQRTGERRGFASLEDLFILLERDVFQIVQGEIAPSMGRKGGGIGSRHPYRMGTNSGHESKGGKMRSIVLPRICGILYTRKVGDPMKARLVTFSLFIVIALCLTFPQPFATASAEEGARFCFPPPAGLTNWWPGDSNTDDIVGGQNAVLRYATTFDVGIVEEAFVLRYPNTMKKWPGNFVEVPHEDALNLGTGDFTVSLWVYFNDTSEEQVLIEKWIQNMGGPDKNSMGWTLTKLDSNVLRLAVDDYGGEIDVDSGVVSIPTHTWLYFAATRESGIITLYMNGTPIATGVVPLDLNLDSESSLKFGHRGNAWDTSGSNSYQEFYLNGRIDEVQLFVGTALNRGFIQAIYRIGSAGLCK
jgi:hypothetical protein